MNKHSVIVGLGEVLWDVFPDGPRFGGAPANFACSAASLVDDAARVWMVSSLGNDRLGADARQVLEEKHVDTRCVQVASQPTGQVHVTLDEEGKASYEFVNDVAWDHLHWEPSLQTLAEQADAVCFGTLGQRSEASRTTIARFLDAMRSDALKVFDINLRPPFFSDEIIQQSLQRANVLKLNDDELPVLQKIYGCEGSEIEVLQRLAAQCELRCVALTRGSDGALLIRDDEVHQSAAVETEVVDTVGAGDAFTAALVVGLLAGEPLPVINQRATRVAAFVCSQAGATPPIPPELR